MEDTQIELQQEVLDEGGKLSDDTVVAITTTITTNVTLGELKAQSDDFTTRLDNLESFYQNQKSFLLSEKQKVDDQIAQFE